MFHLQRIKDGKLLAYIVVRTSQLMSFEEPICCYRRHSYGTRLGFWAIYSFTKRLLIIRVPCKSLPRRQGGDSDVLVPHPCTSASHAEDSEEEKSWRLWGGERFYIDSWFSITCIFLYSSSCTFPQWSIILPKYGLLISASDASQYAPELLNAIGQNCL